MSPSRCGGDGVGGSFVDSPVRMNHDHDHDHDATLISLLRLARLDSILLSLLRLALRLALCDSLESDNCS